MPGGVAVERLAGRSGPVVGRGGPVGIRLTAVVRSWWVSNSYYYGFQTP